MASEQAESNEAEVARETAAAFGRAFTDGETAAFLEWLSAEIRFEAPSVMKQTALTLNGHDEVRAYVEQTAGEYDELHIETRELRDLGGGRFLMTGWWEAKPHARTRFGTPLGVVFEIRDGKVARMRAFFDEQLAIDAAGLA